MAEYKVYHTSWQYNRPNPFVGSANTLKEAINIAVRKANGFEESYIIYKEGNKVGVVAAVKCDYAFEKNAIRYVWVTKTIREIPKTGYKIASKRN